MLCMQCKERDAVIHLTQVSGDQVSQLHLCEKCGAEKGVESGAAVAKTPLGSFLAAMGKGPAAALPVAARDSGPCPGCGASLQDFRESGRLGCSQCYGAFEGHLRELLRRLHGSTLHTGERYARPGQLPVDERQRAEEIRERLRAAVAAENFELAAELRDLLRVAE